jgi:L-asparaginase
MGALPRVALFFTGGTIDSVGVDRLDLAWYIESGNRLVSGEFLQRIPEIDSFARLEETSFRKLSSHALVDKDWLDLLRTIQDTLAQDRADGVVITHGTNTLEETAYFLNLTLKN